MNVPNLAEVDHLACKRLASLLIKNSIPEAKEDTNFKNISQEQIGNFYLFLVAICHQTSPLYAPAIQGKVGGIHRRGWDFLVAKFEEVIVSEPELLYPCRWTKITVSELSSIFKDYTTGKQITEPEQRSELIIDLGLVMKENHWSSLNDIYTQCGGSIKTGKINLLDTLDKFKAYRVDPLNKKSLFLLSIMRNNYPYWQYVDDNQLGPPVDYHEIRGHLRIGTVKICSHSLHEKLLTHSPVTEKEDYAIRQAVYQAIMLLSKQTGLNPSQLHYLFWNVFRCFCKRESPLCNKPCFDSSFPKRYLHLCIHKDGQYCPFSDVCESSNSSQLYLEQVFQTDYY